MHDGDLSHLSSPENRVGTGSVSSSGVVNGRGKIEKMSDALQTRILASICLRTDKSVFKSLRLKN